MVTFIKDRSALLVDQFHGSNTLVALSVSGKSSNDTSILRKKVTASCKCRYHTRTPEFFSDEESPGRINMGSTIKNNQQLATKPLS